MTDSTQTTRKPLKGLRIGTVISDARDKTRKVSVDYQVRHPKYGKYLRRSTVLHVHDEANASKVGDRIEVAPCRPLSKTKSWRMIRIVESAPEN